MTDSQKQDQALKDYIEGKTELSRQYQRLPAGEPGDATDHAILAAARKELASRRSAKRWFVPVAIAAMLLLGASVVLWQQPTVPPTQNNAAAPAPNSQLPREVEHMLHDNPKADHWLEQILKLQQAGKSTEAAQEFHKFRQAYPAYSLDPQRFGALRQYDRQE